MKVNVTAEHITDGRIKDSHNCMIADAIKEAVPHAQFIIVDLQTIRYSDPVKRKRFKFLTPAIAQQNLIKFDKGDRRIQPFTFTLRAPKVRPMETRTGLPPKRTKAHLKKYAYLAGNRAARLTREREFGLRKFVEA